MLFRSLAIAAFNYQLPNDVDYIRAGASTTMPGVNKSAGNTAGNDLSGLLSMIPVAGIPNPPTFKNQATNPSGTTEPTYVPTKMQIQIQAVPMVSRNSISNNFSLKDYATGKLLRGSKNKTRGIW